MEASTDTGKPVSHALIAPLRKKWIAEHDPAKRRDLASQLVDAVMHDYDEQPTEIADEVARDGLPRRTLAIPPARSVVLKSIFVLPGAHRDEMQEPQAPIFRRIASNRLEAWIPKEGWLFDAKGKLLADAHVPRRDGMGRDWLGAFLPDGRWITTDLWMDDRQLTLFDRQGDPRWELPGKEVVAAIDKLNKPVQSYDSPFPSCGWARADVTGQQWLVCFGREWTRGLALVTPHRAIHPLQNKTKMWQLVYPRSMDYRGMFTSFYIESDDADLTLSREEAGHGMGVGWPDYTLASERVSLTDSNPTADFQFVIPAGSGGFGFWPKSHDVYIHSGNWRTSGRVWFFNSKGVYQCEVAGIQLADAANGRDMLTQTDDGIVSTVHRTATGPAVVSARSFIWPDRSPALPLAIYDNMKLGFFLRGTATIGASDDARRNRSAADIVLASW